MASKEMVIRIQEQGAASTEKSIDGVTESVQGLDKAEKKLQKTQSASATSQKAANKGAEEGTKKFKVFADLLDNLGVTGANSMFGLAEGIGEVKGGFSGLKTAIAASGLGLIVALLPTIIEQLSSFWDNLTGINDEIRELENRAYNTSQDIIEQETRIQRTRLRNREQDEAALREQAKLQEELIAMKIRENEIASEQAESTEERNRLSGEYLKLLGERQLLEIQLENDLADLKEAEAEKDRQRESERLQAIETRRQEELKAFTERVRQMQIMSEREAEFQEQLLKDILEVKVAEADPTLDGVTLDEFDDEEELEDEELIQFTAREQAKFDRKKDFLDGTLELERQNNEKRVQMGTEATASLLGLFDALGDGSEESQKKSFQRNKAFSLAQAVVSTFQAVNQQLAVPQDALTGQNFVKAGIALTTGLANVASIASTRFESSGSGGGVSAPRGGGGASLPAGSLVPDLPQADVTGQQTEMRAYVVERDITDSQALSAEINARATL